jgi:ATP-binding cassette, subfamily B, bacterial
MHLPVRRYFASHNSTCLVVLYRKTVLQRANHIIVLKDGMIENEGTLEILLEKSAKMQRLWHREK